MKNRIMVTGANGSMGQLLTKGFHEAGFEIIPVSVVHPDDLCKEAYLPTGERIALYTHEQAMNGDSFCKYFDCNVIAVDFTDKDAILPMMDLYANKLGIPVIQGTTGGDRKAMFKIAKDSGFAAVIAPNMAPPLVALMKMIEDFVILHKARWILEKNNLSGLYGWESHQGVHPYNNFRGKKGPSGTMGAFFDMLVEMGLTKAEIDKIRNRIAQLAIGVPERYLDGHGWHFYQLHAMQDFENPKTKGSENRWLIHELYCAIKSFLEDSKLFKDYSDYSFSNKMELGPVDLTSSFSIDLVNPEGDVRLGANCYPNMINWIHNVNGRNVYVKGAVTTANFLEATMYTGGGPKVSDMSPVIKWIESK